MSESLDLLWWKIKKLNFQCVLMDFKEYLLLISNSLLKTSIIGLKVFVKNWHISKQFLFQHWFWGELVQLKFITKKCLTPQQLHFSGCTFAFPRQQNIRTPLYKNQMNLSQDLKSVYLLSSNISFLCKPSAYIHVSLFFTLDSNWNGAFCIILVTNV